jgi:ribosomal-protein-alanine N-acetyltransferase
MVQSKLAQKVAQTAIEAGKVVYLRKPRATDKEELLELTRVSKSIHHPWITVPAGEEEFEQFLRDSRRHDSKAFLVCNLEDKSIAGVLIIKNVLRDDFQSGNVQFYVGRDSAGKGYMTEGLSLLLRYAKRRLKLHRLDANIQQQNKQAIALVMRCGFKMEGYSKRFKKVGGRWRDHERWAILLEE